MIQNSTKILNKVYIKVNFARVMMKTKKPQTRYNANKIKGLWKQTTCRPQL